MDSLLLPLIGGTTFRSRSKATFKLCIRRRSRAFAACLRFFMVVKGTGLLMLLGVVRIGVDEVIKVHVVVLLFAHLLLEDRRFLLISFAKISPGLYNSSGIESANKNMSSLSWEDEV